MNYIQCIELIQYRWVFSFNLTTVFPRKILGVCLGRYYMLLTELEVRAGGYLSKLRAR
jgi:hypothetical protein